jgi:hypothetical protein
MLKDHLELLDLIIEEEIIEEEIIEEEIIEDNNQF